MSEDPVAPALRAFQEAHFAGDRPDAAAFCAAHSACGPRLRQAIDDFLLVVDGLRAEPSVPASARRDERIGGYRVLRVLGEGGMGTVLLCQQDEPVQRQVAIKVIRGAGSPQLAARFARERQALARMNHESIARVFEAGATTDGRPYLVMEFVEGEPITAYCDRQRLPLPVRLRLFRRMCEGVQHAHHKGVVHRDLKPSNVLVAIQGERAVPKIIDFGLARATSVDLQDGSLHTLQGQVLGTPEYMSPEQAGLGDVDVDARTDVYSLGVLLHELLVGETPLPGLRAGSVASMQQRIRTEEPPRPSDRAVAGATARARAAARACSTPGELRRSLLGDLDAIVGKALEKDPRDRYQTPTELAADIERHLRDEPVQAASLGTWYRARKYLRRHRVRAAVAGAVLAGLVAALILSISLYVKADEASRYFRLLATQARLANADAAREALYPAWPSQREALAAWLAEHGPLSDELPRLQQALADLEGRATSSGGTGWRFVDPLDQFVHAYLAPLVQRLRAWADAERGQARSVRDDLAWAERVHDLSVAAHAEAWQRVASAVAADRRFRGLRLQPQIGLVPLGPDPDSGLQEFVHLRSAAPGSALPARAADSGRLRLDADSGIVLVLLPAATFTMGAVPAPDPQWPDAPIDPAAAFDEGPPHPVPLSAFFIGKHETTQAQWFRLSRGQRPSYYAAGKTVGDDVVDERHPVENLDALAAEQILRRHGLCLPTEAQWEYACRAGTRTVWFTGDSGASLAGFANVADRRLLADAKRIGFQYEYAVEPFDDGAHIHTWVGRYRPNRFGLYDMHGNVAEWCRDRLGDYSDPVRPGDGERLSTRTGEERIYRGGSFIYASFNGRCADRDMEPPATANRYRGVRAAQPVR